MRKNIIITVSVVFFFISVFIWYNRPERGIHRPNSNACLIEGTCIMINWDATKYEADSALKMWKELKDK